MDCLGNLKTFGKISQPVLRDTYVCLHLNASLVTQCFAPNLGSMPLLWEVGALPIRPGCSCPSRHSWTPGSAGPSPQGHSCRAGPCLAHSSRASADCPGSALGRHLPLTQPEPIAWTSPRRQPACPPSPPLPTLLLSCPRRAKMEQAGGSRSREQSLKEMCSAGGTEEPSSLGHSARLF